MHYKSKNSYCFKSNYYFIQKYSFKSNFANTIKCVFSFKFIKSTSNKNLNYIFWIKEELFGDVCEVSNDFDTIC